jgi:hypothetical protein
VGHITTEVKQLCITVVLLLVVLAGCQPASLVVEDRATINLSSHNSSTKTTMDGSRTNQTGWNISLSGREWYIPGARSSHHS